MEKGGVDHSVRGNASPDCRQDPTRLREETVARIHKLHRKFTAELLSAALFLLLSIAALYDFAFSFSLPENIRAILGNPPSVGMIGAVLLLYVFSSILLILSRMMSGSGKYGGVSHVGFIGGFYLFYHFSGMLRENFWAVFAAGVTIFGLEGYHLWIYCSEEIEREREAMALLGEKSKGQKKDGE
jgi:hypothetical protein